MYSCCNAPLCEQIVETPMLKGGRTDENLGSREIQNTDTLT